MNLTQLADLGEFIGGVAVLVTLIYLALQIRQSAAVQESSAIHSWYSTRTVSQGMPALNPELSAAIGAGARDSRLLSEENWVQFGFWCQTAVGGLKLVQELHRKGAISESVFEEEIQMIAGLLRDWPGVRQWWDAGGRSQLPSDLVELVDGTAPRRYVGWDWSPESGFQARPQGVSR